ncbi:MAG: S-adenosyl-l-methionine hydroxide adenosyltransferase family protein, partial [Flammeovirgaceae bacterium]
MAIVTLLTDSGESDHYVAAIKAKILGVNPGLTLVDISHKIAACDIAHGAFVLKSVFRDFPAGTVHLVGVDALGNRDDAFVALQLEDHFFVGVDNGLLGLISDKTPQQVVQLNSVNPIRTTFPEKDVFAPAAAKLASKVAITALGKPMATFKKMTDRHVKANKRLIAGHVIRVDHFGNLITNIPKDAFDVLSNCKTYTVQFGGEKFRRIHKNYFDAEPGD